MQYEELEWSFIEPKKNFIQSTISQTKFTIPITLGLLSISYYVSNNQSLIPSTTLFIIFSSFVAIIYFVINWAWYYFSLKIIPPPENYKLNFEGVRVNSDLHPMSTINNPENLKSLTALKKPYEQWNQITTSQFQSVTIQSDKGKITLNFQQESDLQKFIIAYTEHQQKNI